MATIKQIKDSNGNVHDIVDTKNTAGSTNSSSKLYLIGATEQTASPQTYSHYTAYVGTDGCLYSNDKKVITESDIVNNTTNGLMLSSDKTKLDKIQDYYEVIVPMDLYNQSSSVSDIPQCLGSDSLGSDNFSLNIGDKIRIKSNITENSIKPVIIHFDAFDIYSSGVIRDFIGRLIWDGNNSLAIGNNNTQSLSKYGGYIDVIITSVSRNGEYTCVPLYNNYFGYISGYSNTANSANTANTAISSNKTDSHQIINYGNIHIEGTTTSDIIPPQLIVNEPIVFGEGNIVTIIINMNQSYRSGSIQTISVKNIADSSISIQYCDYNMCYSGISYEYFKPGYNSIDILLHYDTSWTGYVLNISNVTNVNNATNATNATNVTFLTSSTSSNYPIVFTSGVTSGNKRLYTDSVNSCHYNPNTDTFTSPTVSATNVSATNVKTSSIANTTSGRTITFNDAVSLKDWSYVKGIFNFKGTDHDNAGVEITGGSTTTAPTVKIRAKDSSTTNGIVLTGRNDSTAAKIVVYSGTGGTCTITGGSTSISSDERLKDFTNDIDIDFNKLKQIPKKYFTWKHDDEKVLNIGTSAQAVENVYPEIVDENFNEDDEVFYKSVDYSKLSIIALAAIDKLNERIVELENKIKDLEQK